MQVQRLRRSARLAEKATATATATVSAEKAIATAIGSVTSIEPIASSDTFCFELAISTAFVIMIAICFV